MEVSSFTYQFNFLILFISFNIKGFIVNAKTCSLANGKTYDRCEWIGWTLPWNCTCCGNSMNYIVIRKRSLCCEKNVDINNCLNQCNYNRTSDTQVGSCQNACPSEFNKTNDSVHCNASLKTVEQIETTEYPLSTTLVSSKVT